MKVFKIIIIFVLGFSIGNCYSQDIGSKKEEFKSQWINAGIGGGDKLSSLSLGVNNNYKGSRFLSLRYIYSEASLNYSSNNVTDYHDLGLLHGWMYKSNYIFLSASAGFSLLRITRAIENSPGLYPKFKENVSYNASIPIEIKLMFVPLKFLSIGGSINGNINSVKGYHTFMVEIGVGNFK